MILLNDKINDIIIRFNVINMFYKSSFNIKTLNIIINVFIVELTKITSLLNTFISVKININFITFINAINANNLFNKKLINYNTLISENDNY